VVDFTFAYGTTPLASASLRVTQWTPTGGANELEDIPLPSGSPVGFSVPITAYYKFAIVGMAGTNTNLTLQPPVINLAAQGRFSMNIAPSLSGVLPSMSALRHLGVSLLYQNQTAEAYASGALAAAQLTDNDHWIQYINPVPALNAFPAAANTYGFGKIDSLDQSEQLLAKTGIYMWLKPATLQAMEWRRESYIEAGNLFWICHPMRDSAYQILTSNIESSESGPTVGTYNIYCNIEAQTSDTTREQHPPPRKAAAMNKLQDALTGMSQYSENPMHWGAIWDNIKQAIGSGARFVQKWAPTVAEVAGQVGEMLV